MARCCWRAPTSTPSTRTSRRSRPSHHPVGIEVDGQACGEDFENSLPAGVTVTFGGVEHDSLGPSEADYEIDGGSYAVRIGQASFGSFGESELLLKVLVVGVQ